MRTRVTSHPCLLTYGAEKSALPSVSFLRWVPKATDIHSEYAIIIAVPLQQLLHERASRLCNTYIDWLVNVMLPAH
jgi:hypothetical protein